MQTRTLTGLLLIFGPILSFIVWAILSPAIVGSGETVPETLQLNVDNQVAWSIFGTIGALSFAGSFVGFGLLSAAISTRALRGEGKPGTALAAAAVFLFPALTAVIIANTGLAIGAVEAANDYGLEAGVPLLAASQAIGAAIPTFWGVASIFLGLAMWLRASGQIDVRSALGAVLAVAGVLLFLGTWIDFNNTPIGIVVWLLTSITTVAIGVVTLRGKETS